MARRWTGKNSTRRAGAPARIEATAMRVGFHARAIRRSTRRRRIPCRAGLAGFVLVLHLATCAGAEQGGARPDSNRTTSARLDSLEAKLSRNWLTRSISHQVFQPSSLQEQGIVTPSEDPFTSYAGAHIRTISIEHDDVQTALNGFGRALHVKTRRTVIQRYLLMKEGESVDPRTLADTERLLRAAPFIQEARIVIVPVPARPDSVDLVVITRDRWSVGFDLRIRSISSVNATVVDRNCGGWGHALANEFQIETHQAPAVGYVGEYRIDNIRGSFVRNIYQVRTTRQETSGLFSLSRERVAPLIRSTGALTIAAKDLEPQRPDDPPQSFLDASLWFGRAFAVEPSSNGSVGRSAIVVAGSCSGLDFHQRPDSVSADVNRRFSDRVTFLSSVSFTKSDYSKGRLLFGYGPTEDIPYGLLATVTAGAEVGEFETRGYAAGEIRAVSFTGWGYFGGGAGMGAFVRRSSWEDGVVNLFGTYFSPLLVRRRFGLRQHANVEYSFGIKRREGGQILLDEASGLAGLRDSRLADGQRFVGNLESVVFTPWTWFDFRFSFFGQLNIGTIGSEADSFLRGKYYSTIGLGIRIHNEQLILDPLEFRSSFSMSRPEGSSVEAIDFGNLSSRKFRGLDPGQPSILPYR